MGKGSRTRRAKGGGRKRKANVQRTPAGAPSRAKEAVAEHRSGEQAQSEQAAMAVALSARRRKYGASDEAAKDQRWASAIGRLRMTNVIDDAHYDAAVSYLAVHGRYLRSIGAPGQPANSGEPQPCGACGSYTACDSCAAELADSRKRQRNAAQAAVMALCEKVGSRLPAMALDNIVLRDIEMPQLVPWLLTALTALAEHFGVKAKAMPKQRRKPARTEQTETLLPSGVINPNMLGDLHR